MWNIQIYFCLAKYHIFKLFMENAKKVLRWPMWPRNKWSFSISIVQYEWPSNWHLTRYQKNWQADHLMIQQEYRRVKTKTPNCRVTMAAFFSRRFFYSRGKTPLHGYTTVSSFIPFYHGCYTIKAQASRNNNFSKLLGELGIFVPSTKRMARNGLAFYAGEWEEKNNEGSHSHHAS